jgi:hypothetical protein
MNNGKFTQSLLEKIEYLLNQNLGDRSRLEHIKKSIIENKKIYNSDIDYVEWLETKKQDSFPENTKKDFFQPCDNSCWKCKKEITENSKYCSFCGVDQNQKKSEFDQVLSRRIKMSYNPLKLISNFHSYQILAVVGGFAALIPILIVMNNLENILESIKFYTGQNFSEFTIGFTVMGTISVILSCLVMIVPFLIKKPKKVGRILFFSSFGILVFSIFLGIVGFVIILFTGIVALKRRY